MELVYLWVEEYKNIYRQGFNFSPRFECKFHDEYDKYGKLRDDCILDIQPKKHIENFFGNNINVTSIVGKNGSGKSNLIDLILHPKEGKTFIILYDNKYFYIVGATINGNSKTSILMGTNYRINMKNTIESVASITTIHYENTLSIEYMQRYNKISLGKNNKNIGISRRIFNVNHRNTILNEEERFLDIYEQYRVYKSQDLQDIINFLKSTDIRLPFKIPKDIFMTVKILELEKSKIIQDLGIETEFKYNSFLDFVKMSILYNFLHYKCELQYVDDMQIMETFIDALKNQEIDIVYDKVSNLFSKEKWMALKNGKLKTNSYVDLFKEANNLIELLNSLSMNKTTNTLVVNIDIQNIPDNLINIYEKVIGAGIEFLSFSFPYSLSRGEENFISFFASLYTKNLLKYTDTKIEKNIILTIDEGELTFHAQWQKKYINYIVKFLEDNYSEKNIHIIFTTHSPLLLSDIPKQNVIFLDKEKNGNCKVLNHDEVLSKEQTFGANIHTLLSDSFFMEDGLMGEFAKNKIRTIKVAHRYIVHRHKRKTLFTQSSKRCRRLLIKRLPKFWDIQEIIGEPFLKTVIKNYLDEVENILFDDAKAKKMAIKRFVDEFDKDDIMKVLNDKS